MEESLTRPLARFVARPRNDPNALQERQPFSFFPPQFPYPQSSLIAMPAYKNTYVPPPSPEFAQDIHLHTPAAEYDLNFIFASPPIDVLKAEGIQVELEPLVVRSFHLQETYTAARED